MTNSITTSVKLEGRAALRRITDLLPREIRQSVLRSAVTAGARPVEAAAKSFAPVLSGALRKSIKTVIRNYPQGAGAIAIVGPDKDYYRKGRPVKKGGVRLGAVKPAYYAHLVEYGHHVRQPKKGRTIRKGTAVMPEAGKSTWVPAKPFMRPAAMAAKEACSRALLYGAQQGIEKARERLVRQYGHKS